MNILSIESSCDETAAAVVRDGRQVLSSVIASQVEEHKRYGGVVPEIASRRHTESISGVVREALDQAGTNISELDAVAVTHAPGLIGALLVGVSFAKSLSLSAGLPLIPVHHLRAHIAANYLCYPELKPPFLCLVVSGGHSHIVEVTDYTSMKVIGRTRDDAAGEAFDKAGRAMGLSYPGGVYLDEIAETGNPEAFKLPRPVVDNAPYDFSFSGLKTAVINLIHNAEQKGGALPVPDLSSSFRRAVVNCLRENVLRVAEDFGYRTLVLAGGVCANRELRRQMEEACTGKGHRLYMPALNYCGDNAAMVGAQAYYEWKVGHVAGLNLNAAATLSIEENG